VKEINYLYAETYEFLNTSVIIFTLPASRVVVLMLSCSVFRSISNGELEKVCSYSGAVVMVIKDGQVVLGCV